MLVIWLYVLAVRLRDVEMQLEGLTRLDRRLASRPSTRVRGERETTTPGYDNTDSGA
jgi:hypothetical protein